MNRFRMSIADFRVRAFLGKPPSALTVRRWLENGHLVGEKIGGTWYVLVDRNGEPVRPEVGPTGHRGADELLQQWASAG